MSKFDTKIPKRSVPNCQSKFLMRDPIRCLSVNLNHLKMVVAPQKRVLEQNSQLQTPLKFGSPVFRVSMEMENWCQPLQKMGKVDIAPQKTCPRAKLPITDPLKFGLQFSECRRKQKIGVCHYRKWGKWP